MRRWRKVLVAGGLSLAVLAPAGVAVAATTTTATTPAAAQPTCTGDQQRLHLHDGTGWRHATAAGTPAAVAPGVGYQHRSGPMDGSGPQSAPAWDGTGMQWRAGR